MDLSNCSDTPAQCPHPRENTAIGTTPEVRTCFKSKEGSPGIWRGKWEGGVRWPRRSPGQAMINPHEGSALNPDFSLMQPQAFSVWVGWPPLWEPALNQQNVSPHLLRASWDRCCGITNGNLTSACNVALLPTWYGWTTWGIEK